MLSVFDEFDIKVKEGENRPMRNLSALPPKLISPTKK
jgi:hypothetical protein